MKTIIKNGRILDPKANMDGIYDLLIEGDKITKIEEKINEEVEKVIDAGGCWVVPGLIDVHVHFREPGFEYKETIETGSRSAAAGGFTTVCCMPNTNPVIDNEILVEYIRLKAEKEALVHVLPIGSVTKGQKGEELSNIGKMAQAGICAISEDGKTVMDAGLYKKAMVYAKMFNLPVLSHCEDPTLAGKGVMNAGAAAAELGLQGIPAEAEEVIVARDLILAGKTGAKLHICHASTKGSIEHIAFAKGKGQKITVEACPHHFTLTEQEVEGYDGNTKMNPPLRSEEDVEAIKQGLEDGTIDIIATDHAPHHLDEKQCEYDKAAFGIIGLETAVQLTLTELVHTGLITPMEMVEKMSRNPAKLLGLDKGTLQVGTQADITIIDPQAESTIDIRKFVSKCKNSPFHGRKVRGIVKYTIVDGVCVYQN